jgi:opacity protein-like surface antigen
MNLKFQKQWAGLCLIALSSCTIMPSLQDAKVLEKQQLEVTPYIGLVKEIQTNLGSIPAVDEDANKLRPLLGFKTRYGLGGTDLGFNADLSTNFGFSVKHQLSPLQYKTLAASIGADAGCNILSAMYGKVQAYYSVPLYLSYHPHEKWSIYATPRYIGYNEHWSDARNAVNNGQYNRFMISYGLLYGQQNKLGIEVIQPFYGLKQPIFMLGYAVRVNFKKR